MKTQAFSMFSTFRKHAYFIHFLHIVWMRSDDLYKKEGYLKISEQYCPRFNPILYMCIVVWIMFDLSNSSLIGEYISCTSTSPNLTKTPVNLHWEITIYHWILPSCANPWVNVRSITPGLLAAFSMRGGGRWFHCLLRHLSPSMGGNSSIRCHLALKRFCPSFK
jgi:hypothetical protein